MAEPISFDPFLGWVDVTDPHNVPTDAKVITAADLLRYEQFNIAVADKVNTLADTATAADVVDPDTGRLKDELLPVIIDGGTP